MIYLEVNSKYCVITPDVAAIEEWLNTYAGRRYSEWDWLLTGYRFDYRRLIRVYTALADSDIVCFKLKFGA